MVRANKPYIVFEVHVKLSSNNLVVTPFTVEMVWENLGP